MHVSKAVILFAAAVLVMGNASLATQERLATYRIHEVPDDPQSDVVFVVTLTVKETARDGDYIGWEITEARLEQPGDPSAAWIGEFPAVWSPDGLWWIEHADPDNPTEAEFTEPPWVGGVATALEPAGQDLNFAIEGVSYVPPSGGAPHPTTGALDYNFTLVEAPTPLKEGEDEPVEIDPIRDPPGDT
jgi:hypothetical protein